MKKYNVVTVGGSASGLVASMTGKANYNEKSFLLIRKEKEAMVPCGIPYIFNSLESSDKNVMPIAGLQKSGVDFLQDEVIKIDRKNKTVSTKNGETIEYEKLIIATGSEPYKPKWLKGTELENVFVIPKDKIYLDEIKKKMEGMKKIVTIGAGFIGVEMSEQLSRSGKDVTLIEVLPTILGRAFDSEIAVVAKDELEKEGVKVKTGVKVVELIGTDKVEAVLLENGERIDAEAVVLSMGYVPNISLAVDAGLDINKLRAISVDSYMKTDDDDIFAVGDCAAKVDFITRRATPIMLASTAASEARIAGMNLYNLSLVRTFTGTIAIFSTKIGNKSFASAGITEDEARKNKFEIEIGYFEGVDKHPGTLPNTSKQIVKIIAAKDSGIIIGGEIIGGDSIGELINVIGREIQNRSSITDLYLSQIGTHPLLTAAPTNYPLIKAAEMIVIKRSKM